MVQWTQYQLSVGYCSLVVNKRGEMRDHEGRLVLTLMQH